MNPRPIHRPRRADCIKAALPMRRMLGVVDEPGLNGGHEMRCSSSYRAGQVAPSRIVAVSEDGTVQVIPEHESISAGARSQSIARPGAQRAATGAEPTT